MSEKEVIKGNEALHSVIGGAFVESLDKFKGEVLTFVESLGGETVIIEARKSIVRRMFKTYDYRFQDELKEVFEELGEEGEFEMEKLSGVEALKESREEDKYSGLESIDENGD